MLVFIHKKCKNCLQIHLNLTKSDLYKIYFLSVANLPNLIDGITEPQFKNILDEFIRYRKIEDPNSLFDALQFQYTYWPQPTNYSFIRKELIEVHPIYTLFLFG